MSLHSLLVLPLLLFALPGAAQTSSEKLPGLVDKSPAQPSAPPSAPKPKDGPLDQARAAAEKGDFAKAAILLKAEAEKGNPDAALGYGDLLLAGKGVKQSATAALEMYEKSGTPAGQLKQADVFLRGAEGVPADLDRAKFLYTAAADAGLQDALIALASLAQAEGAKSDAAPERERHFTEARAYYERAKDHPSAMFAMSRFHEDGLAGCTKDTTKAADLCRRAALAGHPIAKNDLGIRLQKGQGLPEDNVAALGWFLSAAEAGVPAAMVNLAAAYESGNGLPQNFDAAGSWYARAAKLDYAPAQFLLGRLFEEGRGTPRNPVSAYVNYARAADGGLTEAAAARDRMKPSLSPAQIRESEALLKPAKAK